MNEPGTMGIKEFPKLAGPPPSVWGVALFAAAVLVSSLFPVLASFLAFDLFAVAGILTVVIKGGGWLTRADRSFLLISALIVILATYGLARGFSRLDLLYGVAFEGIAIFVFYLALRIFAFRYAWTKAIEYADSLGAEDRVVFADQCRTRYRRRLGALQAGAEIYRSVADEGLSRGGVFKPIHVLAMQKYAHMLIYGEAKGMIGEGEWYAKKAHELSLQLLKKSDIPATVH